MKKITLLLAFVACVTFANAQTNLLVNPSFESWTGGNPDGWTIPANSTHAGSLTWSQESTIKTNGASSLKLVIGTTQNPGFAQVVPITAGKTYTLTAKYYVVSGDGSDVRIWSGFKNGATYWGATDWAANTALQLLLQGSGSDTGAYFTIANGVWGTYTTEFVAPANATDFSFECRSYKSSTVIWDDMFFGEKATGLSTPKASTLEVLVSGKNLLVKNVVEGSTVEIFSAVGSKVQTSAVENGKVSIANLKGGMYVVRSGKLTQKIML
jgi:hypothetical protein